MSDKPHVWTEHSSVGTLQERAVRDAAVAREKEAARQAANQHEKERADAERRRKEAKKPPAGTYS